MLAVFDASSEFVRAVEGSTVVALRQEQLAEPGAREARNGADALVDSAERLAELSQHAFWTTLAVEEGRPIRGLICVAAPTAGDLTLSAEVAVSVPTLVQMLTAAGGTPLGVHCDASGRLVIWGFLGTARERGLRLRLVGPGHLVLTDGIDVLAVAQHGEVLTPRAGNASSVIEILGHVLDAPVGAPTPKDRAAVLLNLATVMRGRGHGGTILVGSIDDARWLDDLNIGYPFDPAASGRLAEALAESIAASPGRIVPDQPLGPTDWKARYKGRLLTDAISAVGRLTAIDGALVLDETLTVLGFGAKMQPNSSGDFTVTTYDFGSGATAGNRPHTSLGGMRHQSAARFAHVHHDCAVIVASQDDRVSLFAWGANEGEVVAVMGLEHALWDYEPG